MNWLDYRLYNNTLEDWLFALTIALGLFVVLRTGHRLTMRRLRVWAHTTHTQLDDYITNILSSTHFLFFTIAAIYFGTQHLHLPPKAEHAVTSMIVVSLLMQLALWGHRAIAIWLSHVLQSKRGADGAAIVTVSAIGFMVRIVLWSVVALMILENIGVNVTALVASLGIGGIAVALAMQNILSDIFASLSITLDKPFVIGDFIVAGETTGVVEHIGLKTTRLRSLSGEQIVLPNADLLKSRIHNYRRMVERRAQFVIGVAPETSVEKLARVPEIARAIVEMQPKARFERTHFKDYGEHTLNFEVVYFVQDPDYNFFMDVHQTVHFALLRRLDEEGIELGFPRRGLSRARAAPSIQPAQAT